MKRPWGGEKLDGICFPVFCCAQMTDMIKSNEQRRIYSLPVWGDKAREVAQTDSTWLGGNITHLKEKRFFSFQDLSLFLRHILSLSLNCVLTVGGGSSNMQSLPFK